MIETERALQEEGVVTSGTRISSARALGFDYRLGGSIRTIDAVHSRTGMRSTAHYITFELIEAGTGRLVWSKQYQFRKSAMDDILYR